MVYTGLTADIGLRADHLSLGTVLEVTDATSVIVELGDADRTETNCRVLQTADTTVLTLTPEDEVLVWLVPGADGIVIGRVGPSRPPSVTSAAVVAVPEELVLEARDQITLKCGDGSITIREDGKILIKGKDLVSHAQRTNRIKGGAVAIN
jgi:hypothetical protein